MKLILEQMPIVIRSLNVGFLQTCKLFFVTLLGAFPLGLLICMCTMSRSKLISTLSKLLVWIIRGTPLLVQLYVVFFGLPGVGIMIDPIPCAILVFAINEGAYSAETVRAALEAVPVGQIEAGYCVGMNYFQIMRRIVIPQAMRTAFPPLSNSLIAMVKDTSLAANITVAEMLMSTQRIVARTYEPLALYLEVGLIYLIFCTVLTRLQRVGEKRLNTYIADTKE